tara:strand:- start:20359 stop:21111 length:753 start_codon:yes stop_codon:yes gene_type:complete
MNRRAKSTGSLIWLLASLATVGWMLPQFGGSNRPTRSVAFVATSTDGRWTLARRDSVVDEWSDPSAALVEARAWDAQSRPIPYLLPLWSEIRCDIWINLIGTDPITPADETQIRSMISAALAMDQSWAGLPTTHGQVIRLFPWAEFVFAAMVWGFWIVSWWVTVFLVQSVIEPAAGTDSEQQQSLCARCRYPLEGLRGDACPECGSPIPRPPPPSINHGPATVGRATSACSVGVTTPPGGLTHDPQAPAP